MISSILIKTKRKEGFTLIELLVVIAIIGTLSTIGFIALTGSQDGANDAVKIGEIRTIQSAITIASAASGNGNRFPTVVAGGGCTKLSGLPTAVKNTITNINLDSSEYFYCADGTGSTLGATDSTWYIVGATGISNGAHQALTQTGEIDGGTTAGQAGSKITGTILTSLNSAAVLNLTGSPLTTTTVCADTAGAAMYCLSVGV